MSARTKKRKLPQLNMGFAPPANEEERLLRDMRDLPTGDAALIEIGRVYLKRFHEAMSQGDRTRVAHISDKVDSVLFKMNGEARGTFADDDSSGPRLIRALAAPDGTMPMYGQPGRFIVNAPGCRVLYKCRNICGHIFDGFDAHAIDFDRPFISETGYRSFISAADPLPGEPLDAWVIRVVENHRWSDGSGKPRKVIEPLHEITGGKWYRGKEEGFGPKPTPDEDDPAWQPGGWLRLAADNPPPLAGGML